MKAVILAIAIVTLPWFGFHPKPQCVHSHGHAQACRIVIGPIHQEPVGIGPR